MAPLTGDPSAHSLPSLSEGITGTCLCKSITLTITQPGLFDSPNGHICHCSNCRRMSGSALGATLLILKTSNLHLSDPRNYLKTYHDPDSASERIVKRSFCSMCSSPIGSIGLEMDERLSIVALGLFPRIPEPEFECFAGHRQSWEGPPTEKCVQMEILEGLEGYVGKVLGG